MFKKKICALALCAVLSAGAVMPAYAEEVYTASVTQELAASSAVEWNGKTELKAGQKYVVTKNVTISKKITVPSGTSLTVKNGAKLWVNTKGSLYIKGTVTVAEGATLAVSGKLYQYKGKKLTVNGTLSMGTKSSVTLNGKFTAGAKSVVKGEPKTLSVGENAVVKLNGKCTSKKLNKAVAPADNSDDEAVKQVLTEAVEAMVVKGDYAKAVEVMIPAGALEAIKAEYAAEESEMDFDSAMTMVSAMLMLIFTQELGGMPEKVEITELKTEYIDPASLELSDFAAEYYKNIENACKISGKYKLTCGENTLEQELGEDGTMVKVDGKWYFLVNGSDEVA